MKALGRSLFEFSMLGIAILLALFILIVEIIYAERPERERRVRAFNAYWEHR